jgi:hypothetical protein
MLPQHQFRFAQYLAACRQPVNNKMRLAKKSEQDYRLDPQPAKTHPRADGSFVTQPGRLRLNFMEIDMAKRKTDVQISLTDWELPKLSNKIEDLTDKTRAKIEKALDEFTDSFYERKIENLIKDTVSDFFKYAAKDQFTADFFSPRKNTGEIKFYLSFSDYDYVDFTTTLRTEIQALLLLYADNGKIVDHHHQHFRELAEELKSLSILIEGKLK